MTDGSCTNPGSRQVLTHRGNLKKWQRSPRFLKMKQDHALIPGAVCAHCGRYHGDKRYDREGFLKTYEKGKKKGQPVLTSLTINHMSEILYLTEDLYLTWDPALMEVCCAVCNGWDRKGKEVCPVCKVNPIKKDDPLKMCTACYLDAHPEIRKENQEKKEAREESHRLWKKGRAEKRRVRKVRHPCKFNRIGGRCGKSVLGSRCQYSPTKAMKMCMDAVAKKGVRV
jgi:hypothetical protein